MEGGLPHTIFKGYDDQHYPIPRQRLASNSQPLVWSEPPLRHGESAERILITCSESGHDPPPDFASARAAARAMASQRFWTA